MPEERMTYKELAEAIHEAMADYQIDLGICFEEQTALGLLGYVATKMHRQQKQAKHGHCLECGCSKDMGHSEGCPLW